MKNKNGITLIALVISIIVMLILAGVSINAIVGENGILTKTQYATFLNEMAAVEEAVQIWKAGEAIGNNGETTAIPTNGMCKSSDITSTERLAGEVGYYRIWSMLDTQPSANILSSANEFNGKFEGELVFYPAGVQDLYYLNNEACGIESKKTYLIDAATGMVYSIAGINLKGVSCYSSNMAKAVMNGTATAPNFAEAEVSGSGEKLAGNVQDEYLEDGTKNPNYNPYGFQIIADEMSNNIYKLYNNGDLYAKGVKGITLNTSSLEMEKISQKWLEVPEPTISELIGYKKRIQGFGTLYYIDKNDDLWAIGNNGDNKLGLTVSELNEYTTRDFIKLNVNGEKVSNIFACRSNRLFVVTMNGNLYVAGGKSYANGVGHTNDLKEFTKVDLGDKDARNIEYIRTCSVSVIKFKDGTYYASGDGARGLVGDGKNGLYKKFVPIWNGYVYKENSSGNYEIDSTIAYNSNLDIASKIKQVLTNTTYGNHWTLLLNDGTVWHQGTNRFGNNPDGFKSYVLEQYKSEFIQNVKDIYTIQEGFAFVDTDDNIYIRSTDSIKGMFTGLEEENMGLKKIIIPEELATDGIKEQFFSTRALYFLSNKNELWGCGDYNDLGEEFVTSGIIKLNAPKMKTIKNDSYEYNNDFDNSSWGNRTIIFLGEDNKYYSINCDSILKGDNILQKNWVKVTDKKVEKIHTSGDNYIGIIEKGTKDVYVAGYDSRTLAQNSSEQYTIPNLIKLDDDLVNGKAKDIKFGSGPQMYILTTEDKLYATGICGSYRLWEDEENKYTLQLVDENVSYIDASSSSFLQIKNNEVYNAGVFDEGTQLVKDLTKVDLSTLLGGSNIKKVVSEYNHPQVITTDGKLITYNMNRNRKWEDYTEKFNGEKVIDVVVEYRNWTSIVLTDKGNIYGCGEMSLLGLTKDNTSERIYEYRKLPLENVSQITSGSGWLIAVKEDGTVWGIGSNLYGVLGRWIGIDRKSPNSRYKTAFEWVECPELEI